MMSKLEKEVVYKKVPAAELSQVRLFVAIKEKAAERRSELFLIEKSFQDDMTGRGELR